MRRFANGYIVLFLIDAGLSLLDELLKASAIPVHPQALTATRNLVAYLVIALSLVVFTLLGIDRRLPKRVFLPLTFYAMWCSLALWPVLGMIPQEWQGLSAALGQAVIGGLALLTLRRSYGHNLLPAELFRQPLFGWRNALVFTAVNLLLLPPLVVVSVLATADSYLGQVTGGFMRVRPTGVYTSERTYHRGHQEVRLVAMMHIAREEYYQELVASLPASKTIILAEGVTDQDRLLKSRFQYGRLASLVGLSSQETMQFDGNLLELDDLEQEDGEARDATKPDIVRADTDLNRFDPLTVEFLNVLGRTLLGDQPLPQGFAAYVDWIQAHDTPEINAGVMDDILHKRNAVVIGALQQSLDHYDTIIVPWGGMHMPAIEAAVLEEGFVLGAQKERLLFAFSAVPLKGLREALATPD